MSKKFKVGDTVREKFNKYKTGNESSLGVCTDITGYTVSVLMETGRMKNRTIPYKLFKNTFEIVKKK